MEATAAQPVLTVQGNVHRLTLGQELDIDTINLFSAQVNELLESRRPFHFVCDFSNVQYMDSAALGVMVRLVKIFGKRRQRLFCVNLSSLVEKLFDQTGLCKLMTVVRDQAELDRLVQSREKRTRAVARRRPA